MEPQGVFRQARMIPRDGVTADQLDKGLVSDM